MTSELKQLQEENRGLKGLVADRALDKQILQEVLAKSLTAVKRRKIIGFDSSAVPSRRMSAFSILPLDAGQPRTPPGSAEDISVTPVRGSFSLPRPVIFATPDLAPV